ncbi:transposase [Tepidibacter sp. Z1-5]|uniref:transposase n=1 Tax=Tepidibacter sp. Z1-5 TaxID=3134138 RepID=UPI004040BDA7
MSNKSKRYTDEFKQQIVKLANNGKSMKEIAKEYNIARSTVNKRVSDYNNTKSFEAKDNRSDEENELIKLRKEIKRLEMKNDILKQIKISTVKSSGMLRVRTKMLNLYVEHFPRLKDPLMRLKYYILIGEMNLRIEL